MNIDLSYINDLKERYIFALINKKLMDDYKQYPSSFSQGHTTMKNTNSTYILTTHTQKINIFQKTRFITLIYVWILGFYADYNIEFNLYTNNIFDLIYYNNFFSYKLKKIIIKLLYDNFKIIIFKPDTNNFIYKICL